MNQPAEARAGQRPHAAHVSLSEAKFIAYMGALGGIIGWIFGLVTGNRPFIPGANGALSAGWHLAATVPAWVMLGAAAALIFTVLVANTDRTDRARVIAISVLSGMFWMPVLNGASELIKKHQDERLAGEAKQLIQEVAQIAESAKSVQGEQRDQLLLSAREKLKDANDLAQRIDSARVATSLDDASEVLSGLDVELMPAPAPTELTAPHRPHLVIANAQIPSLQDPARASAPPRDEGAELDGPQATDTAARADDTPEESKRSDAEGADEPAP